VGVDVEDLSTAGGKIVGAVEAVDVNYDSHPGEYFSFQRAFPTIQVRSIVVVEIGAGVGVSNVDVAFGDLGGGARRQCRGQCEKYKKSNEISL
jgi:hypothetical protein